MRQEGEALRRDWPNLDEERLHGTTVAPRSITITRSAMWWVLGAAVIFFLAAASTFVYYFTVGPGGSHVAPRNIDITVRGPLTTPGGEPVEMQITVINRNRTALELADLVLTYPPGTRSPSDFSTDLPRQRIPLGNIEAGGQRQGEVSAVFVGEEGEKARVKIELEYRLKNSNAIFVTDAEYAVTFASSALALLVDANEEAISGQRMSLVATVSSNADVVIRDAVLEISYPFGFTPIDTLPKAASRDSFWELGDIHPGDEVKIRVDGTLEGQENDERVFTFTLGTRGNKDIQHVEVPLASVPHRTVLARPFIGLSVAVNSDEGTKPVAAVVSQTVNVSIPWKNNLGSSLSDLVIVAQLSGLVINEQQVRAEDGFYRSSDRTFIWDKTTTRGDFSGIAPGESGIVMFSFDMPPEEETLSLRDAALEITVNAAARRSQTGVPETLQASVSRAVHLGTTVHSLSNSFYSSNPFGSVGPIPPKVNEETTFAVVWTVVNTTNVIKNGEMEGILPANVRWLGVFSPRNEQVEFSSSDGTVTWRLGNIDAGVGVAGREPRQIAFALGLTPSATQIGSVAPLVVNQTFSGTDEFTAKEVFGSIANVTTELDDPDFIPGNASVVQ